MSNEVLQNIKIATVNNILITIIVSPRHHSEGLPVVTHLV